jgi:hypothetical protein
MRTRELVTMKIKVSTLQRDIDEGMCGVATRCMEKLAVTRALIDQLGIKSDKVPRLHVRVDGGHIRFNYNGHRWDADTPRAARNALIKFDQDKRLVTPHKYVVHATKGPKVQKMTEDRMEQINEARARRVREGRPDKVYSDPTIHRRVVGYALDERGRKPKPKSAATCVGA